MSVALASDVVVGSAARCALRAEALRGPCLSILLYHRVLPQIDPLFPGEVVAARFDAQLGMVARSFNVLPLADAVQRLREGRLPPRALAITFDDGYADNHDVALPILRRHRLSACFFVATSFLDGGRMWNDTVIECVRRSRRDAVNLESFGLGNFALDGPAQRRQAIDALLGVIKYQTVEQRVESIERLRVLCDPGALPDDLMMRSDQVRGLHAQGMEIGAHTVRHPILSTLDAETVRREMLESRGQLEGLINAPVTLFAYPNGRPDKDYAASHVAIARDVGFAAAVSTANGVSTPGADLHQLPRFTPWDRHPGRWLGRLAASRWRRGYQRATV
jgi:peptidoglycan/xylan/chitin deacetylase (PgdA/CDA1 family)